MKSVLILFAAAAGWIVNPAWATCRTEVDLVWTGTRVGFGGASTKAAVYVAYYNQQRQLAVAKVDPNSCIVLQRIELSSRFGGWDSHNKIKAAVDQQGRLHVVGNMHSQPLVYFVSPVPGDIESLQQQPMTGKSEDRVTYPEFLTLPDGSLLFLYRSGTSGDGEWYVNLFDGQHWRKATEGPIFGRHSASGPVNAYPTEFVRSPDGFYHVGLVWRQSPDVATNYRLSYAKTRDFSEWFDAKNRPIAAPISPETAELIDDVGAGQGLVNNARLSIDKSGRPVIAYSKYDENGVNALFAARPSVDGWSISKLTAATQRTPVSGGGSNPLMTRFSPINFEPSKAVIHVEFPQQRAFALGVNESALSPLGLLPSEPQAATAKLDFSGLVDPVKVTINLPKAAEGAPTARIIWAAQGPNRDRPRLCSPAQPTACSPPPKPLELIVNSAK